MKFHIRDYLSHALAIKQMRSTLDDTEGWSAERRRGWIQERLERTLDNAVRHVPFYRRTLGPFRAQFPEMIAALDLSPLPMTTKQTFQEHFDELISENVDPRRAREVVTSGSTGSPTRFLVDTRSNISQFASVWRALNWTGYRFGDRFTDVRALDLDDPLMRYRPTMNCQLASVFKLNRDSTPEFVRRFDRFSPSLLKAYPSALFFLSGWIEELGLRPHQPERIIVCAETFFAEHAEKIEAVFRAPIHDFYNHNERAGLISTCEHGRYHVHEEYSHLEFLPINGSESAGRHEVVATTFHNDIMPLIRYRTADDVLADGSGVCPCGRTLKTVGRILGRFQDVIVTPDGFRHSALELAIEGTRGITASQIRQESIGGIEVRIVPGSGFVEAELDSLEQGLRSMLGDGFEIEFSLVDEIPPERNGKVPFIVSTPGRHVALERMGDPR